MLSLPKKKIPQLGRTVITLEEDLFFALQLPPVYRHNFFFLVGFYPQNYSFKKDVPLVSINNRTYDQLTRAFWIHQDIYL